MAIRSSGLVFLLVALFGVRRVAAASDKHWVQVHAWLMWTSMGFLFPLGMVLIRYANPQSKSGKPLNARRAQIFFYLHVCCQSVAIVLSTAGMSLLINKLGADFTFTHSRLGLSLILIAWLQPFIAFARPLKGASLRPVWFTVHWMLGTGMMFLGVINCFLGMQIYEYFSGTSLRSLKIAFSIEISVLLLLYLLQDRLCYILDQGKVADSKTPEQSVAPL